MQSIKMQYANMNHLNDFRRREIIMSNQRKGKYQSRPDEDKSRYECIKIFY